MFKAVILAAIAALAIGQKCEEGVVNRYTTPRALAEQCDLVTMDLLETTTALTKASGSCDACLEDVTSADCMSLRRAEDLGAAANCKPSLPCLAKHQRAKSAAKNAERHAVYAKCPTDKAACKNAYESSPSFSGSSADCPAWAAQGECTGNHEWMIPNCARSCCPICQESASLEIGQCPSESQTHLCTKNTDTAQCEKWATTGGPESKAVDPYCSTSEQGHQDGVSQCWINRGWMVSNCMQSCCEHCNREADRCPATYAGCKKNDYGAATHDFNPISEEEGQKKCRDWAARGECSNNNKWMNRWCSKECCPISKTNAPVVQTPVTYYYQPAPQYYQPAVYGNYAAQSGLYGGLRGELYGAAAQQSFATVAPLYGTGR